MILNKSTRLYMYYTVVQGPEQQRPVHTNAWHVPQCWLHSASDHLAWMVQIDSDFVDAAVVYV